MADYVPTKGKTINDLDEVTSASVTDGLLINVSGDSLSKITVDNFQNSILSSVNNDITSIQSDVSTVQSDITSIQSEIDVLNTNFTNLSDYGSAQLSLDSSLLTYGRQYAIRIGKICFVNFYFNATSTVSSESTICTLPEGFRPAADYYNIGIPSVRGSSQTAALDFLASGAVKVSAGSLSGYHALAFVFPIA